MFGLRKLSSLQVGSSVVAGDGWESEKGLRGCRWDATISGGFVVEEARVWQDAAVVVVVRKLEGRSAALMTQKLGARVGAAEVKWPDLALRTLGSFRHLPNLLTSVGKFKS